MTPYDLVVFVGEGAVPTVDNERKPRSVWCHEHVPWSRFGEDDIVVGPFERDTLPYTSWRRISGSWKVVEFLP